MKHPAASLPRTSKHLSKYEAVIVEKIIEGAKSGDAEAQNSLGYTYANGKLGLPQDNAKAKEWYQKAAKQGHAEAKEELAKLGK